MRRLEDGGLGMRRLERDAEKTVCIECVFHVKPWEGKSLCAYDDGELPKLNVITGQYRLAHCEDRNDGRCKYFRRKQLRETSSPSLSDQWHKLGIGLEAGQPESQKPSLWRRLRPW